MEKHIFNIKGMPLEDVIFYKYLVINISTKNFSLLSTIDSPNVKANMTLTHQSENEYKYI